MPVEIRMPQLGESVTEGTITRWLVRPGDRVERYQPVAEVLTDKVNAEIPAPEAGTILSLDAAEGATVPVGARIAQMEPGVPPAAAGPGAGERPVPGGGVLRAGGADMAARYSPAVLRLAREHGIDPGQIRGTGLGGRVTRKDVERYLAARSAPAAAGAGPGPVPAAAGATSAQGPEADQVIPVDPVRRRIAERMVQARHEQPHAWTMMRADVTGLVRLRDSVREAFRAREGVDLTFLPFFIRAVVESLREHPRLNATWAGDHIVVHGAIHISVAVATEEGLAVPVIRNADRLSVAGLAHAVADLAGRARSGRLSLADVQGGTFTVNNTGSFGSVASAPILNYPQAAILTLEAITKEPVVLEDDAIAIRHMVNLCCSFDHRVLDGLTAGRFLQAVKRRLEAYRPGQPVV